MDEIKFLAATIFQPLYEQACKSGTRPDPYRCMSQAVDLALSMSAKVEREKNKPVPEREHAT